ncbi:hypothetical protein ACFYOC_24070 [Nocardiopsis alba]|uniref:hypothetical protein n=1 Tax=Nocardiopsis alba TaxID=53437 RepID=UPI0036918CE9
MTKKNGRPKMVISDAIREAVIELHAKEVGKNEIERRLKSNGLTRHMLDTISKEEGLQWDRSKTKKAVEQLKVKGQARRSLMADRYLEVAGDMLDKLNQPYQLQMLSNKTGLWETYTRDTPPAIEAEKFVRASDVAMKRHQELIEFDKADESDEAKSLLGNLQDALNKYNGKNATTPEEEAKAEITAEEED